MAQQTAVDWLEIQFDKYTSGGVNVPNNKIFKLTEKAKAMEKEQIELAYKNGSNDEYEHWMNNQERITSIDYYNEAYKK